MTEQIFRSPGFFEKEIDLTQRTEKSLGIPAGIIGTSDFGPAFVPVTLGSFTDFERKFGTLNKNQYGPFAVREWLKNRTAVTYIRVLGAGAANSSIDIANTVTNGIVKNAGFVIEGTKASIQTPSPVADHRHAGTVQFIAALHNTSGDEMAGYPLFTDSESYDATGRMKIIRAMIFTATGSRIQLLDHNSSYSTTNVTDDMAKISDYDNASTEGTFKLVVSSAIGTTFGNDESNVGIRIYTASLNPDSDHYIAKFLNTNPDKFHSEQHLLYADFPVEAEIAKVSYNLSKPTVGILSGSSLSSAVSGEPFIDMYGRFDTRYQAAKTTAFISQPFGSKEYDLFHFESLDDGAVGSNRIKVSIANLRKSTNPRSRYGTFTVLIRAFSDTDTGPSVLEQFGPCSLNPKDSNYVANLVGDYKVSYNFDAESDSERRLNVSGKRPLRSNYVRIVMNANVEDELVPEDTLPFGFRGLPLIKTNETLTDGDSSVAGGSNTQRLAFVSSSLAYTGESLTGSILPPVPMRFKSTRGAVNPAPSFNGEPGALELADSRYYWGIKTEKIQSTSSISHSMLQANTPGGKNTLIDSYTKFLGIQKLDTLVTGSGADAYNSNKFSLSKVALLNGAVLTNSIDANITTAITGTAKDHMREAAYIRNGEFETKCYTILDNGRQRLTFASLLGSTNAKYFNRFTDFAKFTNIFYGGFDGLNILDKDQKLMNHRATAVDTNGKGTGDVTSYQNLHANSSPGAGKDNNVISSYRTAARILTNPFNSRVNIVAVPGIRDAYVTDYIGALVKDYGLAIYIMDIPNYDDAGDPIYNTSTMPDVQKTVDSFEARAVDNNFISTYFPDVVFEDDINRVAVVTPSSTAALKAYGYNDKVSFPWFAPAGFNRGALQGVLNTKVRLNTEDRNVLQDARINPIANFPNGGFVIFGQKTLQQDRSLLDRVSVRRMLLEAKRVTIDIARTLMFEQITPKLRSRFIASVTPRLANIQVNLGIHKFDVIMDDTNNTPEDAEQLNVNGTIILYPTNTIEYVSFDFVLTNSGVSFE
mgnify:CR=1 FL=1